MEWLSKGQVVERFWFGHSVMTSWVNLESLVDLISRALVLDGHPVTDSQVWREVILPPMRAGQTEYPEGNQKHCHLPTVVYMHYADWVAEMGRLVGVDPDADIQPNWLDKHPRTHTVVRAMASVAVKVSLAASDAYEQQYGHSMIEAFMTSSETGEAFGQSQARLSARSRGLRVVK